MMFGLHYVSFGTVELTTVISSAPVLGRMRLRPSPIRNLYGHPNPKWIARDPKSVSNRVPIWEIYLGLHERHKPNMDILSPENSFVEMILFYVLLLEKMLNMY